MKIGIPDACIICGNVHEPGECGDQRSDPVKRFAAIDCSNRDWGWAVMADKGDHWILVYCGCSEAFARAECAALSKGINEEHVQSS